jgi:hypothetical protein
MSEKLGDCAGIVVAADGFGGKAGGGFQLEAGDL